MMINWFPGHMNKSLREMEERMRMVDAVIYVLDARAPFSCINPSFGKIIADKPVIYTLNKADMVDESDVKPWIDKLSAGNAKAVRVNSTASGATKIIASKLFSLCAEKIERKKARGINAVIRAIVIGVPNSGKSTLINNMCGKAKTITGNKAGVTRAQQWVKITPYLEVLDTPGTLYPKLDDQKTALNLAFIGSIRDEVLDTYELALELIRKLTNETDALRQRYGITPSGNAVDDLSAIALKRGLICKGGEADTERAAAAVIDDFRKGRMGKIILEKAGAR